ncbi:MAG: hypothetical protein BGO31_15935 [Bacteroidetes bacterium 43-16]|nr:MAG: hypothetical protein BGO31_15935 [Bacteroidetes bacterium 43-16]
MTKKEYFERLTENEIKMGDSFMIFHQPPNNLDNGTLEINGSTTNAVFLTMNTDYLVTEESGILKVGLKMVNNNRRISFKKDTKLNILVEPFGDWLYFKVDDFERILNDQLFVFVGS